MLHHDPIMYCQYYILHCEWNNPRSNEHSLNLGHQSLHCQVLKLFCSFKLCENWLFGRLVDWEIGRLLYLKESTEMSFNRCSLNHVMSPSNFCI